MVFPHFLTSVRGQYMEEAFLFGTPELTDPPEPSSTGVRQSSTASSKQSAAGHICAQISLSREDAWSQAVQGNLDPIATTSKAPSVQQLEGADCCCAAQQPCMLS